MRDGDRDRGRKKARFNIWPPFNLSGQQLWPMAENRAIHHHPKSPPLWILLFSPELDGLFSLFLINFRAGWAMDPDVAMIELMILLLSGRRDRRFGDSPQSASSSFVISPGDICMPHLRTSSSSFIYFIAASFALWTQWPVDIILIIALPLARRCPLRSVYYSHSIDFHGFLVINFSVL